MTAYAHDEKIKSIRRICKASDAMHDYTVRLVDALSKAPRVAASAKALLPKPPRQKR